MAELEQLRAQVEAARERIGEIGESRKVNDERLLGLIASLEQGLAKKQEEIEHQQTALDSLQSEKAALELEMDALEAENGELKSLLKTLLGAIDDNSADPVAAALDALGKRVSDAPQADPAAPEPSENKTEESPAIPEDSGAAEEADDFALDAVEIEDTVAEEAEAEAVETPEIEDSPIEESEADVEAVALDVAETVEPAEEADSDLEIDLEIDDSSENPPAEAVDIEAPIVPCSPEMAAVIEAVDSAADEGKEAVGAIEPDTAAVLEEIASEVNAVADGEAPPQSLDDDLEIEAIDLDEEQPAEVDAPSIEAAEPEKSTGELSVSEIEALLEASGAEFGEAEARPSGRPSTVKKIIERVSALAEEMNDEDPETLLKAVAALEEGEAETSEPVEEPLPDVATGT